MSNPDLQRLLHSKSAEGQLDSSGRFTLSRDRALARLAQFQLPRATSWVLKIIQSAVAAGASHISIKNARQHTTFRFPITQDWSLEAVEVALTSPDTATTPALNHLRQALWNVGIASKRPFCIGLPGANQAWVYSGNELQRAACSPVEAVVLIISRLPCSGILSKLIGDVRGNQAIQEEISNFAYVCPVPLELDGRRMDALLKSSTHGYGKENFPLGVGYLEAPMGLGYIAAPCPQLRTPTENPLDALRSGIPQFQDKLKIRTPLNARQELCSVACIVTFHPHQDRNSVFNWIQDGVVRDDLPIVPTAVSCAVFASAEGLKSDISGFQLTHSPQLEARQTTACKAVKPFICGISATVQQPEQADISNYVLVASLCLTAGASVTLPIPFVTMAAVGTGIQAVQKLTGPGKDWETKLKGGLRALQVLWPKLTPDLTNP